ncbi:ABC transporter ATP-binding protein [Deferrisoma palaeochoriense]
MPDAQPMLKLENVHTYYGNIHALKGVSFELQEGQIGCLIGANGAGKSTTLMTISGIERCREGSIEFLGKPIHRTPPDEIVRMGICQVPEGRRIFPRLTVRENLLLGAYIRKDKTSIQKDMDRVLGYFPRLAERLNQDGGTLSGGEQQMLAIGRALMSRPRLLLLDEPSLGLAPLVVETIFEIIAEIAKEKITVLLVEQNANAALQLADYGWVLETGRIVLQDEAKALLANPKVREAYLGEG